MKLRIFIFMVAMSILIHGCKKNDTSLKPIVDPPDFYMQGLKNNIAWVGYPKANTVGTDSVIVQGSGMFDVLQLKFKINGPGQYTLNSSDAQNLYWLFGEVIIRAKYGLRTDVISTINVINYDATTKIIAGTFTLHLIKLSGADTATPQNVDFTSGEFKVKLIN